MAPLRLGCLTDLAAGHRWVAAAATRLGPRPRGRGVGRRRRPTAATDGGGDGGDGRSAPGLFFQREGPGSEPGNSLLCPGETSWYAASLGMDQCRASLLHKQHKQSPTQPSLAYLPSCSVLSNVRACGLARHVANGPRRARGAVRRVALHASRGITRCHPYRKHARL